jgi:hypothetical protein
MAALKLLGDEQVLVGGNGPLCLTTHRVRFETRDSGNESVDEIFLEDLSYQAVRMSSRPLFLALAGLSVLLAAYSLVAFRSSDYGVTIIAVISAIIFAVVYAFTRRQTLILASSGGRIQLAAKSMPRETLDWFLLKLAEAKDHRVRVLRGAR